VAGQVRQPPERQAVPPDQSRQSDDLADEQRDSREAECGETAPGLHALRLPYGIRIDDPVVPRPSRSSCDLRASLRAYVWWIGIFTAPEPTLSNKSAAIDMRSSRLAA